MGKGKVVDFVEKFNSVQELKEYARAQFLTLLSANKRIDALEDENRKLLKELDEIKSVQKPDLLVKSNEQALCEIEIKRLYDDAKDRALNFEETKRLDLLVKNLYVIKGKPAPQKDKNPGKNKNLTDDDLIGLARLADGVGDDE